MLTFRFTIRNPFKFASFKSYMVLTAPLCSNKSWEIQLSKYAYNIFEVIIDLNWKGFDHAGPSLELNIFGYTLTLKIYDHRHWNIKKNSWSSHDENDLL